LHTSAAVEWAEQRILDQEKKILDQEKRVPDQEKKVIDQIIAKLHIHALEDWYLVPKSHIQLVDGSFKLLKKYHILLLLLIPTF
jgi:hypothetical protein